ncbi:MAG TPA: glycoside hydrolase family 104 protein [Ramlibacter sp.]|uniref:glycoside hydrolase family 24 protein n=1 Tax=Ramlibacter sp. TaxID=1917967 RepID=UPI002ED44404
MRLLVAIVAAAGLGLWLASRDGFALSPLSWDGEAEAEQGATWWDELQTTLDPETYMQPDTVTTPVAAGNVAAFLSMIRFAEGTAGPDGYRTLFGGRLFSGFDDHPRIAVQFRDQAGRTLWTTAAGGYQAMAVSPLPSGGSTRVNTWDRIKAKLQLPDFSPASQDAFAIELIRERGALGDVIAGRIASAVRKCAAEWASLPGAGYAQPERKLSQLLAAYQGAGGITVSEA